jgi:DNA-binding NarL/FixJ family response regulator
MDVLLVDDHPIIHQTLGAVVRSVLPQAQFHAESDLAGGLARARQLKDLELVLLDLGLPGCSGLDALIRFRKTLPTVRIAIISATEDPGSVRAALDAGAVGYVPKTSPPKVLANALQLILQGGTYIPPQLMDEHLAPKKEPKLSDFGITDRQADVLRLLIKGHSNAEIAHQLSIAENTVKQHAHAAYRALGVGSRTEVIVELARLGIRVE